MYILIRRLDVRSPNRSLPVLQVTSPIATEQLSVPETTLVGAMSNDPADIRAHARAQMGFSVELQQVRTRDAMDLDLILEELEGMRPEFPSLDDLCKEEESTKEELTDGALCRNG